MLAEHLGPFLERAEEAGGIPSLVRRELEGYLDCGSYDRGVAVVACRCGYERLVGLSCGGRGFCPSSGGRRMADFAAHLTDHVMPIVPALRQWVISFPPALRYLLGYDAKLCRQVNRVFVRTVFRLLRKRAKRAHGLLAGTKTHPGAVTVVQRFSSDLRLFPHAHGIFLDGVYVENDVGQPHFLPLDPPTPDDVRWVAKTTRDRVAKLVERRGVVLDEHGAESNDLQLEHPALAHVYGAAVRGTDLDGRPSAQLGLKAVEPEVPPTPRLAANVEGFDVHADVSLDGRDRRAVERMARYLARPPICQDRLTRLDDGRVRYAFRRPWKNGQRGVTLDGVSFVGRLAALVPPPRSPSFVYWGVLGPAHHLRSKVIPKPYVPPPKQLGMFVEDLEGKMLPVHDPPPRSWDRTPRQRLEWAKLMRRVFGSQAVACPRCTRPLRVTQLATTPGAIAAVLSRHGVLDAGAGSERGPPRPRQQGLAFGDPTAEG